MNSKILPALALAPIAIGTPIYVYTSHVENQKSELARKHFCLTDRICEGSADNCRDGAVPLRFNRGDNFDGDMQFDNGQTLQGGVTAIAGQMSGRFEQNDGGAYELEIFADGDFTLMHRVPDVHGTQKQTYYQGTCERVK